MTLCREAHGCAKAISRDCGCVAVATIVADGTGYFQVGGN
jgi:hypothetical protein